jgi:hypothetical protein
MMRRVLLIAIAIISYTTAKAQFDNYYHAWNFSYGRTGTPGDQLKVGLEMARHDKAVFYGEAGLELSKYKGLSYNSFSLLAGARYYFVGNTLMASKKKINLVGGLGGVAQQENEKNVYKNRSFSEKMNYGVSVQILGEYFYDPTIGLFICAEQKFLFNKTLGQYNYGISAGLRIHFNNHD